MEEDKNWVISDIEFLVCHCGGMQFQICAKFIMCPKCLRKYNQEELMKMQKLEKKLTNKHSNIPFIKHL